MSDLNKSIEKFQHTAARRRLGQSSRHDKPQGGFNTQPPEGGWINQADSRVLLKRFQHTAARRRLVNKFN